jgi:two-component sensor histidine kinase
MALVHEVMYETDHFDAIDFHVYLNKLLRMVMRVNRIGDVHLALSLEPVTLHIDQAIPCGLIANELLSNALKHAFDDDQRQREIRVEVRQQEDDVSLYVIDNGVGLPATMPENHLGMTIIESLVTQLEGTLTFTNRQAPEHGLIASVCFPNVLPTTTLD